MNRLILILIHLLVMNYYETSLVNLHLNDYGVLYMLTNLLT